MLKTMKTIESKLLIEFKRGDHASFQKIFEFYSIPLFQFSLSYLKSKEAAEDIVQEVFLKVWKNRKEIKTGTSFQSYLFTITLNSVRKHFIRLSRINEVKHEILIDFSAQKPEFDDRSDYQELLGKLQELIERMPEKRRQVFIKKKMEEKSLKEIAVELYIDPKTVEYHITEAMKFLKLEFKKLRVKGIIFFHLLIGNK
jgi:RNA polymerase sigma-70 factor (family 1)